MASRFPPQKAERQQALEDRTAAEKQRMQKV
jgi:hypothetical protein